MATFMSSNDVTDTKAFNITVTNSTSIHFALSLHFMGGYYAANSAYFHILSDVYKTVFVCPHIVFVNILLMFPKAIISCWYFCGGKKCKFLFHIL